MFLQAWSSTYSCRVRSLQKNHHTTQRIGLEEANVKNKVSAESIIISSDQRTRDNADTTMSTSYSIDLGAVPTTTITIYHSINNEELTQSDYKIFDGMLVSYIVS